MGQTLTHGVYLPDEGERNCYNGLAANWSILDGAVGTVAEHTTQIAGKAPAVHTHTKADVTDLLNSNFIPSANSTYNIGSATYRWNSVWGTSFKSKSTNIDLTDSATTGNKESWYFSSYDKNENAFFSFSNQRNHSAGSNEEHFRLKNASGKWADFYLKLTDSNEFSVALSMHSDVTNKGFRGKFAPTEHLLPVTNNSYDLGSSSSQWNNLYAKNYYYDGVAWGLDKANVWSETQSIKQQAIDIVNNPSARINGNSLYFYDGTRFWSELRPVWNTDGSFTMELGLSNYTTGGNQGYWNINAKISKDFTTLDFYSSHNNANLGTSTNKWKTFNGINPGALSLPNLTMETYDPTNGWYNLDTTDWDLTGSPIDISSSVLKDGYVYVCLACDSTGYVVICEGVFGYPNCYYSTSGLPVSGYARALLPVRRGTDVRLYLKGTSVYSARLLPALGNV